MNISPKLYIMTFEITLPVGGGGGGALMQKHLAVWRLQC